MKATDACVVTIEDNPDNLFIIQTVLKYALSVQYQTARASGQQFFEWLEQNPAQKIDLILLDLQLPEADGFAVLQHIRAHPRLDGVLVVAITANILDQDITQARKAGFDGFIGKPVDVDHLPEQISRILDGASVWEICINDQIVKI